MQYLPSPPTRHCGPRPALAGVAIAEGRSLPTSCAELVLPASDRRRAVLKPTSPPNNEPIAMPNPDDYVPFNEREDVLASLELLALIAPRLNKRALLWKWMIIIAENALQGAMVCALADSPGTSVLIKKSAPRKLDWLRGKIGGNPPEGWLQDFDDLLNKCVSERGLVLTHQQRKDIDWLHEHFRNRFAHFKPGGWAIKISVLPRIISAGLEAVCFLMLLPDVSLDGEERRRLKTSLEKIRIALKDYSI